MYESYFKQSYTYKVGDYAPENYLLEKYSENSKYNSKLTKKKADDTVKGSAYQIGKPEDGEVITKMIFDGTTEEENNVKAYWLASPGVNFYSGYARFGLGAVYFGNSGTGYVMFTSSGGRYGYEFAVRPVVSLKSKVTVEDINTITGTEEKWEGKVPSLDPVESGGLDYGKIVE